MMNNRSKIVQTVNHVLESYFAHAPLKSEPRNDGVDTASVAQVSRELLDLTQISRLPDAEFEQRVLGAVTKLRDVHTAYTLSEPTKKHLYYLPFLVRRWQDGKADRYVVARVNEERFPKASKLRRGAEITRWNRAPIGAEVERIGALEEGAHLEARNALGLFVLTSRWAGGSPIPAGKSVEVEFEIDGKKYTEVFDWRSDVAVGPTVRNEIDARDVAFPKQAMNVCSRVEQLLRHQLFSDTRTHNPQRIKLKAPELPSREFPEKEQFELDIQPMILGCKYGKFGYVRIRSFDFDPAVVKHFMNVLGRLPENGLILDLRENPGGSIPNAEMMLQLLTNTEVRPTGFRFLATEDTEAFTRVGASAANSEPDPLKVEYSRWHDGIKRANRARKPYSKPLPYTLGGAMTLYGQRYYGPCVVIVDALTFSAAEMFAAGFRDNGIGKIIGAGDTHTGGAGAVVWTLDLIQGSGDLHVRKLSELLPGASFRFSALQCVRIDRAGGFGESFESVGVKQDIGHRLTRNDVLRQSEDLLLTAAEHLSLLAKRRRPMLKVVHRTIDRGRALEVVVRGKNVTKLSVRIDATSITGSLPTKVLASERHELKFELDRKHNNMIYVSGTDAKGREAHWKESFPASDTTFEQLAITLGLRGPRSSHRASTNGSK